MEQRISVDAVTKRFEDGTTALDGVSLDIPAGEFTAVVGPSGCGKTTLLRILAGLEEPTSGCVRLGAAQGRRDDMAMVFQEQSIYPWMRVRENVAVGLHRRKLDRATARANVDRQLDLVGLRSFADAYPHQLSGGMKQRVSIARAFASERSVLLMDEPFAALDEQTKVGLHAELLRIWEQTRKTVVFITHGIEESVALADCVYVMSARPGRIHARVDVPFPRPRDVVALRGDPEFGRLVVRVWALLREGMAE
ncbi:MAG TPA: ABC transporter ATP-binding protein [Candidatus Dormibacteraeota bacterium]|nr:ABC transporter ATP-binding protein [Candidatus Dormibacteraeota bacterium]